jgi:8-oxo-dGTP diphosphatase
MTNSYEHGRIAVDAAIFTIKDGQLFLYLNTREKEPFEGLAELPGGLLLPNETAEETLARKLKDVMGVSDVFFEQFHTFTDPSRDPRSRTISIAFIALLPADKIKEEAKFVQIEALPKLAFDHQEIIQNAVGYLQQNIDHEFARQFLPEYFPLNDLQMVYEVITKEKFDNRNFRKKMVDSGIVKKVKKVQENVSHRPAALFKFY